MTLHKSVDGLISEVRDLEAKEKALLARLTDEELVLLQTRNVLEERRDLFL